MLILLFCAFGLPVLLLSADNYLHKKILHRECNPSKQLGIFLWGLFLGGVLGLYINYAVIAPRLPKITKTETYILDCVYDCANFYGNYYAIVEEGGTKMIKILGSPVSVIESDKSKIVYLDEGKMPLVKEEKVCFKDDALAYAVMLDTECEASFYTIYVPMDQVLKY